MRVFKIIKKWLNKLRIRRNRQRALVAVMLVIVGILLLQSMDQSKVTPTALRSLLDTIAKGESNGNYNAYFGNSANTAIRFTDMSIAQVLQWQQEYINQGKASNAVGRYQFMGTTLQGLVRRLNIDPQATFNEAMQDRLAVALIERRGVMAYFENRIGREEFAANLAKEWAALPKISPPNPEQSYYAKDGLNKALISINEIYSAIEGLKK